MKRVILLITFIIVNIVSYSQDYYTLASKVPGIFLSGADSKVSSQAEMKLSFITHKENTYIFILKSNNPVTINVNSDTIITTMYFEYRYISNGAKLNISIKSKQKTKLSYVFLYCKN